MEKVAVAMSGGIDSSVACILLKEQGFDVTGITLKFFGPDGDIRCCGADYSAGMARKVCDVLGIKHYIKDARAYFSEYVVNNFINSYLKGETPNPCIECNRFLKFNYLFKLTKAMGIHYLATGHYARIFKDSGKYFLFKGKDKNKDQSYFLYCLNKNILKDIIFPLGNITKEEVRNIAQKYNLPVAKERESKDICFIPKGNYSLWLKKKIGFANADGYIRDMSGKILGRHSGYFNFTIGQRKNLGISYIKKLYVREINPSKNEIIVAELKDVLFDECDVGDLNWLVDKFPFNKRCFVQIRYKQKPVECFVENKNNNEVKVRFKERQFAVAKGQSAVFYDGQKVLGGGIIRNVRR